MVLLLLINFSVAGTLVWRIVVEALRDRRREHGGGQGRETFAALCQTGDAGQQMAVFVAAVAMDLAAGRFAGTVQPGAGGKNRAADGSFDEFVPEFRVFYCEDFVGIGHGI